MSRFILPIVVLAAMLAGGCAANQPADGSGGGAENYSDGSRHARYYEEIRAPAAAGLRGVECGAR